MAIPAIFVCVLVLVCVYTNQKFCVLHKIWYWYTQTIYTWMMHQPMFDYMRLGWLCSQWKRTGFRKCWLNHSVRTIAYSTIVKMLPQPYPTQIVRLRQMHHFPRSTTKYSRQNIPNKIFPTKHSQAKHSQAKYSWQNIPDKIFPVQKCSQRITDSNRRALHWPLVNL